MAKNSSFDRAFGLNLLSARLGLSRKILDADYVIKSDGPTAHFFDPGGSDRTVTLPAYLDGGGSFIFVAHCGSANTLTIEGPASATVTTLSTLESVFLVASGSEWVAHRAWGDLAVFGFAGVNHKIGLVPDPGATAHVADTDKQYLREDGWATIGATASEDFIRRISDGVNITPDSGAATAVFNSADSSITITVDPLAVTVDFAVDPSNVDHDALLNFVADEHVAHSGVTLTAGIGLLGGGDITASRSFTLDLSTLAGDTPVLGDYFGFYDSSAGVTHKATLTTLNGILDHDALLGFVANEHVDHSLVSMQAGSGLSGGGDISSTRTFTVDITGLLADTADSADEFMFYDVSGGDLNKITFTNLSTQIGAALGLTYFATGTDAANLTGTLALARIAQGTNGQLLVGQTSASILYKTLSGDATLSAAGALTLASTISAGGPTGSVTVTPVITYDAKGRLTAVTTATITPAVGSITGLGSNVATALAVAVGTDGAFVVKGGALGTPSSGTIGTSLLSTSMKTVALEFVIDGGGSTITTGLKGKLHIPFACTINEVVLLADQSGSIVVNVWKCTYTQYDVSTHPVSGDKITASAPPTISTATKSKDSTLTGWTTSVSADDVLAFNVDSVTSITRVTISLKVTKS